MEDFKEQYSKELLYQEIRSNKYTLRGFALFLMAVAFIWLLTMIGFFEIDKKFITVAFVSNVILFLPIVYIYFKSDLSKSWVKYFLLLLISVVSGVIASILSFHAVLAYVIPLLFAVQYRRKDIIYFVFVVNTITMLISSIVSFYYGLCDLNILLQSQHVRSWYLESIVDGVLNIPFNENPMFVIIVYEVFPRTIIFFVFSIIMQYTVMSYNEDAYKIAQLTYFKEMDTKTGVFNKNKYMEMVSQYYPIIDQVAVLFWDLNDLKTINDQYGHDVGDKAIEKLAFILFAYTSDRCRVYRIGGDEFLTIIDNPKQGEIENIINSVQTKLKEDSEIKISSAVGYAVGRGMDVLETVKEADTCMYENKKIIKDENYI